MIGSHAVDELVKEDVAEILVYDNCVCGTHENLANALRDPRVKVFDVGGDICQSDILNAVHYPAPLHRQPAYEGIGARPPLRVSERLATEVVSLPMHPDLDATAQDAIIAAVREVAAVGGTAARARLTGSC